MSKNTYMELETFKMFKDYEGGFFLPIFEDCLNGDAFVCIDQAEVELL